MNHHEIIMKSHHIQWWFTSSSCGYHQQITALAVCRIFADLNGSVVDRDGVKILLFYNHRMRTPSNQIEIIRILVPEFDFREFDVRTRGGLNPIGFDWKFGIPKLNPHSWSYQQKMQIWEYTICCRQRQKWGKCWRWWYAAGVFEGGDILWEVQRHNDVKLID